MSVRADVTERKKEDKDVVERERRWLSFLSPVFFFFVLQQTVLLGRLCLGPARVRLFPLDPGSLSGYSQPAGPGPFELPSASCRAIADQIARQLGVASGEEGPGRLR